MQEEVQLEVQVEVQVQVQEEVQEYLDRRRCKCRRRICDQMDRAVTAGRGRYCGHRTGVHRCCRAASSGEKSAVFSAALSRVNNI